MKITGYTEVADESYNANLLLAFSDFITEDSVKHDKEHLVRYLNARFEDDYPDFKLDEDSIDKAVSDLKKIVKLFLNSID